MGYQTVAVLVNPDRARDTFYPGIDWTRVALQKLPYLFLLTPTTAFMDEKSEISGHERRIIRFRIAPSWTRSQCWPSRVDEVHSFCFIPGFSSSMRKEYRARDTCYPGIDWTRVALQKLPYLFLLTRRPPTFMDEKSEISGHERRIIRFRIAPSWTRSQCWPSWVDEVHSFCFIPGFSSSMRALLFG